MTLRVATAAGLTGLLAGAASIPIISTLPGPLRLCTLLPQFDCITGHLSGAQYLSGDSPAAFWWMFTSLFAAPGLAVIAARIAGHQRPWLARAIALLAVAPVLLLLLGTYALVPFHPIVAALTVVAAAGVLVARPRP